MNTKTFNHFRNLFAFVGFFIIACSAAVDDSPVEEPPVVQNNIGKYQISITNTGDAILYMTALNTESGKIQTYIYNRGNSNAWETGAPSITLTH